MIRDVRARIDMKLFGRLEKAFLRHFMNLERGISSHDAFPRPVRPIHLEGLQRVPASPRSARFIPGHV